jgi:diadenylate cyclase
MQDLWAIPGWRDALDLTIVSLVLYKLLKAFRGTRAARILVGLTLLLIVSLVASALSLNTLEWLLQGFWAYIVIALIVIFQPELRRTLARLGEARFLKAFTSAEELRGLEEVVRASVAMAERKIGALIVIERETELGEHIELGTMLDAKVSKSLLMSIFHPTSPIHDGAVVIKGNRVVAAGCFLPIALSSTISPSLGTRHRAALGITEESDAVVIIISEETGGISISVSGRLESQVDMGSLRDMLTNMFTSKKVAP